VVPCSWQTTTGAWSRCPATGRRRVTGLHDRTSSCHSSKPLVHDHRPDHPPRTLITQPYPIPRDVPGSPSRPSTSTPPAPQPVPTYRVPRWSRALTSYPVVRYIGRDDAARTVAGWQHWLDAVTGWLREGCSPTVFIHTPDNVGALELARRFHGDVRARVPEVEPLPEPIPSGSPTLF